MARERDEEKLIYVGLRVAALESEIATLRAHEQKVPQRLVRELAHRSGQQAALERKILPGRTFLEQLERDTLETIARQEGWIAGYDECIKNAWIELKARNAEGLEQWLRAQVKEADNND